MDARWRIELLGGLRARGCGQAVTRFRTQKTGLLLAYLAYYPQRTHRRESLIELLWPEAEPEAGRRNLSRELSWLRRQFEPRGVPPGAVVLADRAVVRLNSEAVATDVAEFEAALHAAKRAGSPTERASSLAEAIEAYGGELLPGHSADWVLQEREWLAERYFQALGQLIAHLERTDDLGRAVEVARRGVSADPLREETHVALIRLYAATGQLAAALRQYRLLEELLKKELGASPTGATRALAADIERRHDGGPGPPPRPPILTPLHPHNLPLQLTSFIGREQQMGEVQRLLASHRLVTLIGAGGCGKTRLALQVAAQLLDTVADGVWLVAFASLMDPTLVPQRAAAALDVREQPGCSLVATLTAALKARELLLVLDNCEHLVGACAELSEALLRACPHLRILLTSREPLGIAGETPYRVPPLSLPDERQLPGLEDLTHSEAVRLFVERSQTALPTFRVTEANAPAVLQVCQRLDGIPLAIELAAGRMNLLSVEQIAARLNDPFRLLTGGSRTALARHQTLRATLDWSYGLLSEPERALLRRFSVFAGGWTLEAAEAVCSGDGIEAAEVLDLLMWLVQKSLVVADEPGVEGRCRLLDTIREYGRECLATSGEEETLRRRHAAFFLALAEKIEPELRGRDQLEWLDRLECEHDNLRVALAWTVESGEATTGLRLAGALARFWDVRRHLAEGRKWLAAVLSLPGATQLDALRAKALYGAGLLAGRQEEHPAAQAQAFWAESLAIRRQLGDRRGIAEVLDAQGELAAWEWEDPATRGLLEESLAIWRELGDPRGIASSLLHMGWATEAWGDEAGARAIYEEALGLNREIDNRAGQAETLCALGQLAYGQGDYPSGRALLEESLAISRGLKDRWGSCSILGGLGWVAFSQGEYEYAQSLWEETLAIDQERMEQGGCVLLWLGRLAAARGDTAAARALHAELVGAGEELLREKKYEDLLTLAPEDLLVHVRWVGHRLIIAYTLLARGDVARGEGDHERARGLYAQSLALQRRMADREGMAACLEGLAGVRGAQGQPEPAALLLGAAAALRDAIGRPVAPADPAEHEGRVAAAHGTLGEEAFAAAWAAGQALSLEQAIEYALLDSSDDGSEGPHS